jgi:HK97 family phage major capsid protein
MNLKEMQQERAAKIALAKAILAKAEAEKRALTKEEREQYDGHMARVDELKGDIERAERLEREERESRQPATQANRPNPAAPTIPVIGLSDQQARSYSFVRAIRAASEAPKNPRAWEQIAPFEMECSQAVTEQLHTRAQGFYVPPDVIFNRTLTRSFDRRNGWMYHAVERRDMTKAVAGDGGNLIATDLLADSFIEMLRNRMMVQRAGATILGDLVGDIAIPKQSGGATAYWVAEGNSPTESNPTVAQVTMVPRTVGAWTDITRKLLKQSSIDVEAFVRRDLSTVQALAIDLAALHGAGAGSNEPQGIAGTSSVGVAYAGGAATDLINANGAAVVWADIVKLETLVAASNADIGALAYMMNPLVRGALKTTAKVASSDSRMIWDDSDTPLNGYPAWVTNQVSHALSKGGASDLSAVFFGNWADLIIGMWGALDILVDPYTGGTAGTVRVITLQDVNSVPRHAESFAVILDADA